MDRQSGQRRNQRTKESQLEQQIAELMEEVDRYRTACEDTMQQLDWCIGFFTGCNKRSVARSLSANRSVIRRRLLQRPELPMPSTQEAAS